MLLGTTAVAPLVWGSTYLVTTELLPPGRPLLAATVRALPAGILLVVLSRRLPRGSWWWRACVLGALNIAAFFSLLFLAAFRLPGGVAAVVGAIQPLLVALLASRLLAERLTGRRLAAAVAGIVGVATLVLRADARLDAVGVAAAVGGAVSMSVGVVLTKRWGRPAPLLAMTGWQLTAGGLLLAPLALAVEGPPPASLPAAAVAGFVHLTVVGTAVAYALWFRGIQALPATDITLLGLLSPLVATVLGWVVLGERLSGSQIAGGLLVLGALLSIQTRHPNPRRLDGRARPAGAPRSPLVHPIHCPAVLRRRTSRGGASIPLHRRAGSRNRSSTNDTVLVLGATGHLGHAVNAHLLDAGHGVVALLRPGASTAALPSGVRIRRDAAEDPGSLRAAVAEGIGAVVHLAPPTGDEAVDQPSRDLDSSCHHPFSRKAPCDD